MRILIINPNSDAAMTSAILAGGREYADGEFEVDCLPTPGAPQFIETYGDQAAAAAGMIELVRANEEKYDAFVVACHCDPNLDLLKEITRKPVVGIGEASMKVATMLGHRFSVVSTDPHSVPNKEALARNYHLEGQLASVRAPSAGMSGSSDREKYLETARAAIEEDGAEVVVLGCAGMTGLAGEMQNELGAPVLDGVLCALMVAAGLVRQGISTSKVRRYNPDHQ